MKYIVAVSGGVDSMVLLDMMVRAGEPELIVAHFMVFVLILTLMQNWFERMLPGTDCHLRRNEKSLVHRPVRHSPETAVMHSCVH